MTARGLSRLVRAASMPRRRLKAATKLSTILDTTPCTSTALWQCARAHDAVPCNIAQTSTEQSRTRTVLSVMHPCKECCHVSLQKYQPGAEC